MHPCIKIPGKWVPVSWETLPWHLILAHRNNILEKGNWIDPLFIIFQNKKLTFSSSSRPSRSCRVLLGIELKEEVNFWKTENKGSIKFLFHKIWSLGTGIRCHGSVSWESGRCFPENVSTSIHKWCLNRK